MSEVRSEHRSAKNTPRRFQIPPVETRIGSRRFAQPPIETRHLEPRRFKLPPSESPESQPKISIHPPSVDGAILPVRNILKRISDAIDATETRIETGRKHLHEKATERQLKKEERAENFARVGKERRQIFKKLAPLAAAGALAVVIPETRTVGVGIAESLWQSALNGRLSVAPLLDRGEEVIMTDGVPYFQRYAKNIYHTAKADHPELFEPQTDQPHIITCEVQQSDTPRYPQKPPEKTSWYVEDTPQINELMIDGVAQLYLHGLLTFSNPSLREPLLLSEIQQQAQIIIESVQKSLIRTNKTGVSVASLNPNTRNNGALVTGAHVMQEFISFAQQNGDLSSDSFRLHDRINQGANAGLSEPLTAAIQRQQASILEMAYHQIDKVNAEHMTIDQLEKIRQFHRSPEGLDFISKVLLPRINPGLVNITVKPNGEPFNATDMGLSLCALYVDGKINIHNLDSVSTDLVASLAAKLQASGSRFNEFQMPGSLFTMGAGIVTLDRKSRSVSEAQVVRSETSQPETRPRSPIHLTRRGFVKGAVGVAGASALAAIAYEAKLNKTPIVADALFDGDTWERFLQKAPLLTRDDITADFAGSTRFYYRDGTLLDGANEQSKQFQYRESCLAEEIPDFLRTVIVEVEDHRMYQHDGVDPFGIVRAIKSKVSGGNEGASTIAMQLVRNIFGNISADSRSWDNKKLEVVGALFLFQHEKAKAITFAESQGKTITDQEARLAAHHKILTDYLNIAPFRGNVLGVKKASEVFFGKPNPKDMTDYEQLFLAGLPKSPVGYDPFSFDPGVTGRNLPNSDRIELFPNHPALERMADVVWMLEHNPQSTVPPEKIAKLKEQLKKGIIITKPPDQEISPAFAYVQQLYSKIPAEQLSIEADIVTTIDRKLDLKVKEIGDWAREELSSQFGTDQFDIVVRDMATGNILSLYGTPGRTHMTGSIAKTFTVTAAMEAGLTPGDLISDQPFEVTDSAGNVSYRSHNFDGTVHGNGQVTLNEALERSYNNPFLHLIRQVGIPRFSEMMQRLGAVDNERMIDLNGLSPIATLGTNPITNALRISTAFTVLGDQGRFHGSTGIREITSPSIGVLYESRPQKTKNDTQIEQVVDPEVASDFVSMLSDPTWKLNAFVGNRYVVKTGTSTNMSEDESQGAFNGWAAGYALVDPAHRYQITCVAYRGNGQTPLTSPHAGGENTAGAVYKKIVDYLTDEYHP